MQYTIQIIKETVAQDVVDQAPLLYEKTVSHLPPRIDDFAEDMFFEVLANIDVHYVRLGYPEADDHISRETLEEQYVFPIVHDWFRTRRVTSVEYPARGGGFSCLKSYDSSSSPRVSIVT